MHCCSCMQICDRNHLSSCSSEIHFVHLTTASKEIVCCRNLLGSLGGFGFVGFNLYPLNIYKNSRLVKYSILIREWWYEMLHLRCRCPFGWCITNRIGTGIPSGLGLSAVNVRIPWEGGLQSRFLVHGGSELEFLLRHRTQLEPEIDGPINAQRSLRVHYPAHWFKHLVFVFWSVNIIRIETICQQTARKKLTELVTQVHFQEIRRLSTEWELDCQRCVDIPFIVTSYRYSYSHHIRFNKSLKRRKLLSISVEIRHKLN